VIQLDLFAARSKPDVAAITPSPPSPTIVPLPSITTLPERVRIISLHRPYAGLVAAGLKTFETRMWPWPSGPGWLLIHESKTINKEAMRRLGAVATNHVGVGGVALVLVWIAGCRLMTKADEPQAMIEVVDGRWVWEIGARHPLIKPIPMVGHQKFWSTPREDVVAALELAA
jgi:hypothetical protein